MAQIHIRQWHEPIEARGRQNLLEAALAAGVPFPHGCMSGECGNCKCRVLDGDIEHGPHLPEALSAEERAQGLALACRTRAKGPVAVEWLVPARIRAAVPPVRRVKARVLSKQKLTHDVIRLELAVQGKPLHFLPGQFARLRVGRLPARSYSMANLPDAQNLEFHIRIVPQGVVSGAVAQQVVVGDVLSIEGPFGAATWAEPSEGPLLLVAGGTGLAPIRSVLLAALAAGQRDIHLYHGVRDERDLYGAAEFLQLQAEGRLRYTPVLSAPSAATARRCGWVHQAVAQDHPSLAGATVFVGGPPPMVDAVKAHALAAGVDPQRFAADAFFAAPPESSSLLDRLRRLFGGAPAAA